MAATALRAVPSFVDASPLVRAAYGLAETVHAGPLGSGRTSIEHPVAVAKLLSDAGFPPHVLAAALLHDTVEDGGVEIERLRTRFGGRVARLVEQLTEDASIASFARRKASLRRDASDDHEAAAIFAADKLATVRVLLRGAKRPAAEKLEHYERSLWLLRARHPEVPFLDELETALIRLRRLPR